MPAQPTKKKYYRDDSLLKAIGENIRALRLKNGLTQKELAIDCNDQDYSQINRVELGKVNFSISYLALVAKALEVNPKELLP